MHEADVDLRTAGIAIESLQNSVARMEAEVEPDGTTVQDAIARFSQARGRLISASEKLKPLPADHPQVARVLALGRSHAAGLQAVQARLVPFAESLQEATGDDKFPRLAEDAELVEGVIETYREVPGTPDALLEIIRKDAATVAEINRIETTYQPLFAAHTSEGEAFERRIAYAKNRRAQFHARLAEVAPSYVDMVGRELDRAEQSMTDAVENKRPGVLTDSLPQSHKRIAAYIAILEATVPDAAPALAERLGEQKATLAAAAESLGEEMAAEREETIRTNQIPADAYAGDDREELIELARARWMELDADAEIFMVRIPTETWTREEKWVAWRGELTKEDKSTLGIRLIVAHTDDLAAVRTAWISKDHMKGDAVRALSNDSPDYEVPATRLIPMDRVREAQR